MRVIVPVKLIESNPYRDFSVAPYDSRKIDNLIESIRELGFWENVTVRPKNNSINGHTFQTNGEFEQYLFSIAKDNVVVVDFPVELHSGHHRIEAYRKMLDNPRYDLPDTIEIPVKFATKDYMLRTMAYENKDDWGQNASTIIETVRQVYNEIKAGIDAYELDDFEKYLNEVGHIKKEQVFKDAKTHKGIGAELIASYLKGTWNDESLRGALNAIKTAKKGYFDLKDCSVIQNATSLRTIVGIIDDIHGHKDLPPLIKELWTEEIFDTQKSKNNVPTTKLLKDAKAAFKKQFFNPIAFLKNRTKMETNVKGILATFLHTKEIYTFEEASKIEGLEGWDDVVKDAIELALKKKARQDQKDNDGTDDQTTTGQQDDQTTPETGQSDQTATAATQELPPATDPKDLPDAAKIEVIADTFKNQVAPITHTIGRLADRAEEIDKTDLALFDKLEDVATIAMTAVYKSFGKDIFAEKISTMLKAIYDSIDQSTEEPVKEETPQVDPPMAKRAAKKAAGKKALIGKK